MTEQQWPNDPAPAAPGAPAEKAGFVDDLIEIWFAPSKVFARRRDSGFFGILVVLTVLLGGLWMVNAGAMQGIMDAEYQRQMAEVLKQNPNMTQEQLDAGKGFAQAAQTFGVWIGVPIAMLLVGLGAWIVGKVFGAELGYGAATMVACWAYLPKVLESLLITVQGLVLDTGAMRGRFELSWGVGRFLDPEGSMGMQLLLGRIDVFTIWVSVLIAIGIVVVGKVDRSKLVPVAVVMWLLGAIPGGWTLLMEVLRGGN